MKKLAYICFGMLLLGCANTSEEKSFSSSDIAEDVAAEVISIETMEEAFPYATITEQKLQEYFDLVALQNKHPEFAEVIATQLHQLSKDAIMHVKGQDSIAIKNLSPLGKVIVINDTLQQQKFTYTMASKTIFKTDTLTVNITTKPTIVDGIETVSTKVIFSRN